MAIYTVTRQELYIATFQLDADSAEEAISRIENDDEDCFQEIDEPSFYEVVEDSYSAHLAGGI